MVNRKSNENERLRGKIMEMVKRGQKTLIVASVELGISYLQVKRIYKRYLDGGDKALVHGNNGKPATTKLIRC